METPIFTVTSPVELVPGRFKVEIRASNEPTLIHKRFGRTADEARRNAKAFTEGRLAQFYKSLAGVHARRAGRLRQAAKAAAGADAGAESRDV